MTILLHCYSEKNQEYQDETNRAVMSFLAMPDLNVVSRLTTVDDDLSYWKVLCEYWGKDDLIHVQQDIVPTKEQITSLLDCRFGSCTYPHKLESGWGLWKGDFTLDQIMPAQMHFLEPPFPEFVTGSGIGLVGIKQWVQRAIPLGYNPQHWSMVDTWISAYMYNLTWSTWHVHSPAVRHARMEA